MKTNLNRSSVVCPSTNQEKELAICEQYIEQMCSTKKVSKEEVMPLIMPALNGLIKSLPPLENEICYDEDFFHKVMLEIEKLVSEGKIDLSHLGDKVIKRKFIRKFKMPLRDAISRAQCGDTEALFHLIEVDSDFLFEDWVAAKVRGAKLIGDREFFKGLGKAIAANKGLVAAKNPLFSAILSLKSLGIIRPKSNKQLQGILDEASIFKDKDAGYLSKFSRRRGLG
jgi:hypothetical protein